jgi:hypothetical protein
VSLGRLLEGQLTIDHGATQRALAHELDQLIELFRRNRGGTRSDDAEPVSDDRPHVDRDHRTVERAARDEATAWSKRRKTLFKAFSEDRVEYRLYVKFREALVVIGKRLGTKLAQTVMFGRACSRVDVSAEVATDIDGRLTRSARAGLDEEPLARLELGIPERGPRRLVGHPQPGGTREVHRVGNRANVFGGRREEFRIGTRRPRDEYALARIDSRPGGVDPGRVGRGRSGHFRRHSLCDIEVVDGRRLDPHEHLPIARSRIRYFLELEYLRPAAFVDHNRAHRVSPSLSCVLIDENEGGRGKLPLPAGTLAGGRRRAGVRRSRFGCPSPVRITPNLSGDRWREIVVGRICLEGAQGTPRRRGLALFQVAFALFVFGGFGGSAGTITVTVTPSASDGESTDKLTPEQQRIFKEQQNREFPRAYKRWRNAIGDCEGSPGLDESAYALCLIREVRILKESVQVGETLVAELASSRDEGPCRRALSDLGHELAAYDGELDRLLDSIVTTAFDPETSVSVQRDVLGSPLVSDSVLANCF